jgi:hypothetical protein
MAFPKTQSGTDLMLEAPSRPEPEQLEELGLKFVGLRKAAPDAGGGGTASGPSAAAPADGETPA